MISELFDGTRVRRGKVDGLLKRLGRRDGSQWRACGQRLEEENRKSDRDSAGRRVVQLEDSRRHDRMREFNFLGLSIISSARGPSSFLTRFLPCHSFSHLSLIFRCPAWLSLRYPCEWRTIFPASPSFLPLSNHILKNSRKCLTAPSCSLPLLTHEVIKIWQTNNFSNATWHGFSLYERNETSPLESRVNARSHVNEVVDTFPFADAISKFGKLPL